MFAEIFVETIAEISVIGILFSIAWISKRLQIFITKHKTRSSAGNEMQQSE